MPEYDPELECVERLTARYVKAVQDAQLLAADYDRTPPWHLLTRMRLVRRIAELDDIAEGARREAERLTAGWECT